MDCACHGNFDIAPVPMEGEWVALGDISQISGLSHGVGGCPPQQGACKLTLNVKNGVIKEALVETVGCSGMTQSAVICSEILAGKNLIQALNTHLVCDAINVAMKNAFSQFIYGRTQTAFTKGGLPLGTINDELAEGKLSHVGTVSIQEGGIPDILQTTEGYITDLALDENDRVIGYRYLALGRLLADLDRGSLRDPESYASTYGRYADGVNYKKVRGDKDV